MLVTTIAGCDFGHVPRVLDLVDPLPFALAFNVERFTGFVQYIVNRSRIALVFAPITKPWRTF